MRTIRLFLILSIFLISRNVFSGYVVHGSATGSVVYGSATTIVNLLNNKKQKIEWARKNYKPYECEFFKINDKVSYSFSWTGGDENDFIGVVTRIEPKPTNEGMHWITIEKIFGHGEGGTFSEHFLVNLEK